MADRAAWRSFSSIPSRYHAIYEWHVLLRSGSEHRNLEHNPSQIELIEKPGERAYLQYTEDISKDHPGGLKGRKQKPKVVVHSKDDAKYLRDTNCHPSF